MGETKRKALYAGNDSMLGGAKFTGGYGVQNVHGLRGMVQKSHFGRRQRVLTNNMDKDGNQRP